MPFKRMQKEPEKPPQMLDAAIEGVLKTIQDGRHYNLRDIVKVLGLPERQVERVIDFLSRAKMVEKGVKITKLGTRFLELPRGDCRRKPAKGVSKH